MIDVNQNLEKPHYSKAERISTEMTVFHETTKYAEYGSHKTKIAWKSREVGCPRKADIDTSVLEDLMWSPGTLQSRPRATCSSNESDAKQRVFQMSS